MMLGHDKEEEHSIKVRQYLYATVLLSIISLIIRFPLLRHIVVRVETVEVVFLFLFLVYYVQWVIEKVGPLMKAAHLAPFDMQHTNQFDPPSFIDLCFSDLGKYDEFWRYKHKNFSFCASQGFRDYMEDRMHFMHDPNNNLSIFGMFDGHGGQFISDFLETNFARSIRDRILRLQNRRKLSSDGLLNDYDPVVEGLVTEVHNLDDSISRLDPEKTSLTGSTLIAAVVEGQRYLTVINVGDSRAVACDGKGKMLPLSFDHKPSDKAELRRIEAAGGFVTYEDVPRVQGILAVSRSFGDTLLKRLGVLTAHPDVRRIDLAENSLRFIIVATDGFWDVVDNEDAVKLAQEYLRTHPRQWHRVASYLVRLALSRNTHDNVSVLFIRI